MQALCHTLIASNADTALLALTALHNLLRLGEEENAAKGLAGSPVVDLVVDCGGAAHIEALLEHVEAHELRCPSMMVKQVTKRKRSPLTTPASIDSCIFAVLG